MCTAYTAAHRLLAFHRVISLFHFRSSTDKGGFGRRSDDGDDGDGAGGARLDSVTTPSPEIGAAEAPAVSDAVSETFSETMSETAAAADRAPMGS